MNYNALEIAFHARLGETMSVIKNALLDENDVPLVNEEGAYILQSPLTPIDLIKFPNIVYDDTEETTQWVRPTLLYANAESATLGRDGLNFVRGIYQVSIFTPRNVGTELSNLYATGILRGFPKGERLLFTGGVIMIDVGYQSTNLLEDNFLHTPVTIPFTAHMEV